MSYLTMDKGREERVMCTTQDKVIVLFSVALVTHSGMSYPTGFVVHMCLRAAMGTAGAA